MKRLFLTLFSLIGSIQIIICGDLIPSTLILYRTHRFEGSAISYKVKVNDLIIARLNNKSFYIYECPPGEYDIIINNYFKNSLHIKTESGKTYYLKVNYNYLNIPEFITMDSTYAVREISNLTLEKFDDTKSFMTRPKSRVGVSMSFGGGFENCTMFTSTNGDTSSISFGGGLGFGLKYGYEIIRFIDIAASYNYQSSQLTPTIKDVTVNYSRNIISITPSFIIPINGGDAIRIKIGSGIDYYWNSLLRIESSKIPQGIDDDWDYKNTFGYHVNSSCEFNTTEKWSLYLNFKWYNVNYEFKSGKSYYPTDDKLIHPNGSGFDFSCGIYFHF